MKPRNIPKGLSDKEMKVMSYLELGEKRFFTKDDIKKFFKSENELNVYTHRLKEKGRIVRINKEKYYLIPIQAYKGWVEHPFIVADEMFNGKDYYIGGKAAANYWGFIDQIPRVIDVFSTKKQGEIKILGSSFKFRRVRKMMRFVKRKIKHHDFLIALIEESKKWKE
jgi:predicted transcriptional regulator of viral defense system